MKIYIHTVLTSRKLCLSRLETSRNYKCSTINSNCYFITGLYPTRHCVNFYVKEFGEHHILVKEGNQKVLEIPLTKMPIYQ